MILPFNIIFTLPALLWLCQHKRKVISEAEKVVLMKDFENKCYILYNFSADITKVANHFIQAEVFFFFRKYTVYFKKKYIYICFSQ